MADRAISELTPVSTVQTSDNFVLEQNSRAMRLTGQVLINFLLSELDGHGGIGTITKTSTSGLIDTYTITFADETTTTFTVTNGKGVSSIAKTGTVGLVDTYTITYTDSTTSTFTVTNGEGITDISLTGTSGLVDTYTITYNNGTTSTFDVTNGNGIASIDKSSSGLNDTYRITYTDGTYYDMAVSNGRGIDSMTVSSSGLTDTYTLHFNDNTTYDIEIDNGRSITNVALTSTVGLVDTYTITYNDSTTSTFTITNGAKGDQGDITYVWIKYSTERPVRDADIHDEPDNWIGIYSGFSDSAPTTYGSYQWYDYKGEKGDQGDSVSLDEIVTQYQKSESGTDIPTVWLDEIPSVPSGWYLWTKVSISFLPTGDCTYYTAVRSGVDGSGSVVSVCNVAPDANGDVDLMQISGTRLVIA